MNERSNSIFTEGPIVSSFISEQIYANRAVEIIGAHSIFLGQVRADNIAGKKVIAIEYTCYREMAEYQMGKIASEIISKYSLTHLQVQHSLGKISSGEICLFVLTSSPHRRAATDACSIIVEQLKAQLPIWGKEIFEDESSQWKINTNL